MRLVLPAVFVALAAFVPSLTHAEGPKRSDEQVRVTGFVLASCRFDGSAEAKASCNIPKVVTRRFVSSPIPGQGRRTSVTVSPLL